MQVNKTLLNIHNGGRLRQPRVLQMMGSHAPLAPKSATHGLDYLAIRNIVA